ncbi:MAG: D-isomer specific 2-hydroxyacid dehydrogenase family protein [Actinomycetota bacterium]|nr:D-isomer specific 2-hydroxyacid dehydrogenase family protein [Actinomycetota bacterium]
MEAAVLAGGGQLAAPDEAEGLVWADPFVPHELPLLLARSPKVSWVGLPFAGIEPYVGYLDDVHVWTCAKGVYARPVAEHALMLGLAGLRGLVRYSRVQQWDQPVGHNLIGGKVSIFGGGGITTELVAMLEPFGCEITVVRRTDSPFPGAARTLTLDARIEALRGADLVVLALALTPETTKLMSTAEFAAMAPHAWLVNVARGGHVDNDALVEAVRAGRIGGAALDVTSPEPLPDDHPLWQEPRIVITPHVGNTPDMGIPLLAAHIEDNTRRFVEGRPLVGLVDVEAGY